LNLASSTPCVPATTTAELGVLPSRATVSSPELFTVRAEPLVTLILLESIVFPEVAFNNVELAASKEVTMVST